METLTEKDLQNLKSNIEQVVEKLNIEAEREKLKELQTETLKEDFWENPNRAKETMQEISEIEEDIKIADSLQESIKSLLELYELSSESESDQELLLDEYNRISEELLKLRKAEFLSGQYDKNNAILSIHAGQGGTEAQDWAEMLMRMYTRYAEKKGWEIEIDDISTGAEAGISSCTMFIRGKYAYGLLKREKGTHRLIRLSPFNAQNLRQTSFAGVEVIPEIPKEDAVEIPESDIDFKAVRAGGPGGQGVNKTASAVQLTHIPTGITVHSSQRRSQEQNREAAMSILRAKLWEKSEAERQKKIKNIKGEYKEASWGNQIRNYILHPYKLVKDLRTNVESSNPDAVLDGELEEFIEAEIQL
jgi:peptide chain release factor 2